MLGFKSFESAKITLAGIEVMAMLKKSQSDVMPLLSAIELMRSDN
jgi:hypothetical protein